MDADSAPPQLDVEFLQQAIYNPKDRLFVLKVEQQMRQFLQKALASGCVFAFTFFIDRAD